MRLNLEKQAVWCLSENAVKLIFKHEGLKTNKYLFVSIKDVRCLIRDQKDIIMTEFLDIKGAFDNTSYKSLVHTASKQAWGSALYKGGCTTCCVGVQAHVIKAPNRKPWGSSNEALGWGSLAPHVQYVVDGLLDALNRDPNHARSWWFKGNVMRRSQTSWSRAMTTWEFVQEDKPIKVTPLNWSSSISQAKIKPYMHFTINKKLRVFSITL